MKQLASDSPAVLCTRVRSPTDPRGKMIEAETRSRARSSSALRTPTRTVAQFSRRARRRVLIKENGLSYSTRLLPAKQIRVVTRAGSFTCQASVGSPAACLRCFSLCAALRCLRAGELTAVSRPYLEREQVNREARPGKFEFFKFLSATATCAKLVPCQTGA